VKKHVPVYNLRVRYEAPSGKVWEDKSIEGRFAEWFNENGYLQKAKFKKWLARNVEVVGTADPQSMMSIEGGPSNGINDAVTEPPRMSSSDTPIGAKSTRKTKRKA
jgi:Microsomal signal peptidase 25 kDa subunit (SPC25)